MKITPEQYKAVQSYINYMKDLVVNPSVKNARFQLVGSPSNTLQRASIKKSKSPLALPPPYSSQAEQMKKAMDYDAYMMNLVRNTPTTKALAKTIQQPTTATTAVVQNATNSNNPFYNSIWSLIKDNPKTSYTALSGLFSAPVLYSMFGGSEASSSGTGVNGSNADVSNYYKLLANKAKQDINQEYATAHNKNTGANTGTNTQSATQNTDNNLKQLNELSARVDTNMAKLKALEEETLKRLQEQQAQAKQNTSSTDIGIFDAPDSYSPITPYNPMLPYTPIPSNKSTNNPTENVTNKSVDQGTTQGTNVPEKKEISATGTNTSKNPIVNSVKKAENQNVKKDTGSAKVDVKPETNQSILTPEQIGNYYATQGAKKSVDNPKTALSEAQRDYYRYLTGYQRMSPNQAILSMGLDPNKYYY